MDVRHQPHKTPADEQEIVTQASIYLENCPFFLAKFRIGQLLQHDRDFRFWQEWNEVPTTNSQPLPLSINWCKLINRHDCKLQWQQADESLNSCTYSCNGGAGKKDAETKTSKSTLERDPSDFISTIDQMENCGVLFLNKLIFQLSMPGLISNKAPS